MDAIKTVQKVFSLAKKDEVFYVSTGKVSIKNACFLPPPLSLSLSIYLSLSLSLSLSLILSLRPEIGFGLMDWP